jgi:hypothetical protein
MHRQVEHAASVRKTVARKTLKTQHQVLQDGDRSARGKEEEEDEQQRVARKATVSVRKRDSNQGGGAERDSEPSTLLCVGKSLHLHSLPARYPKLARQRCPQQITLWLVRICPRGSGSLWGEHKPRVFNSHDPLTATTVVVKQPPPHTNTGRAFGGGENNAYPPHHTQ